MAPHTGNHTFSWILYMSCLPKGCTRAGCSTIRFIMISWSFSFWLCPQTGKPHFVEKSWLWKYVVVKRWNWTQVIKKGLRVRIGPCVVPWAKMATVMIFFIHVLYSQLRAIIAKNVIPPQPITKALSLINLACNLGALTISCHTFSAFWLWSSVVSVLISVTTDILPTGRLLVTPIFLWGRCPLSLLEGTCTCCPGIALRWVRHTLRGNKKNDKEKLKYYTSTAKQWVGTYQMISNDTNLISHDIDLISNDINLISNDIKCYQMISNDIKCYQIISNDIKLLYWNIL